MINVFRKFLRELTTNRISQIAVTINLLVLIYLYWERQERTGRPFHYQYESPLFKVIYQLDLPAIWITSYVTYPLNFVGDASNDYWWLGTIGVSVLVFFTSLQWGLVGYFMWKIYIAVLGKTKGEDLSKKTTEVI